MVEQYRELRPYPWPSSSLFGWDAVINNNFSRQIQWQMLLRVLDSRFEKLLFEKSDESIGKLGGVGGGGVLFTGVWFMHCHTRRAHNMGGFLWLFLWRRARTGCRFCLTHLLIFPLCQKDSLEYIVYVFPRLYTLLIGVGWEFDPSLIMMVSLGHFSKSNIQLKWYTCINLLISSH